MYCIFQSFWLCNNTLNSTLNNLNMKKKLISCGRVDQKIYVSRFDLGRVALAELVLAELTAHPKNQFDCQLKKIIIKKK